MHNLTKLTLFCDFIFSFVAFFLTLKLIPKYLNNKKAITVNRFLKKDIFRLRKFSKIKVF